MGKKEFKIYNSADSRLVEINNIVDYNYTNTVKCDIKTIAILVDKKSFTKKKPLSQTLDQICKKLSSKNILTSEVKKTCLDIEKDIIDDKFEESVLTIELLCGSVKSMYKIIFMNVKNVLLDILDTFKTEKQSELTNDKLALKLMRNSYEFFEYYRELGSIIFNAMKKNNIYQCNIINKCSTSVYDFLQSIRFFSKHKQLNEYYYSNPEILLLEGFCLSKYELNELKSDDKESKETKRFGDNVYKLNVKGGGKKTVKKRNLHNTTSKTKTHKVVEKTNNHSHKQSSTPTSENYYLQFINLDEVSTSKKIKIIKNEMDNIMIKCKSIYFTRDIINLPPNKATSTNIINTVIHFIARNKLPIKSTILEPSELKAKGLNLLYSVGQGSIPERQSRLLILEYMPKKSSKSQSDNILLIGKGITVDTGGYNLKPGEDIPEMKSDLSGACSVLSSIMACARMGIKKNIVAMLPFAENAIGNKATVSGDVIKAYNGLNVEIIDTDAEGRLIMADTLSYGIEKYPDYSIIELSTLTGEVASFSCTKFNMGIGINWEQVELQRIVNHGEMNGERLVLVPFISGLDDELKSEVADIRNTPKDCQGQLYPSTTFLSYFINDDTKYLHIDIAGTAFKDEKSYQYEEYEASGSGIKLLVDYIKSS